MAPQAVASIVAAKVNSNRCLRDAMFRMPIRGDRPCARKIMHGTVSLSTLKARRERNSFLQVMKHTCLAACVTQIQKSLWLQQA
jgi:hypothetical protein